MAPAHSFGRYRVTGSLGTGAMGEVFAAEDEVLGRKVAVKTLRGHTSALAARLADERFRIEARAIATLSHPHVVQVFDIDLTADPPYLVMERVAGPSLKDRLASGPLVDDELRMLGIQMANALAAAHAAGIVHRDVKPANILSAGAHSWKLADFGVAHVPDSSLTLTGQFVGSPAYAPPEALVKGQLGPAGDVYGLGATLYEAAAGRWPRGDREGGAPLAPVPPLRELVATVPEEIADAIDRAVALDIDRRPTAVELAAALARVSAEHVIPASTTSTPGTAIPSSAVSTPVATPVRAPMSPQARKQIWILTLVTLAIVIIIGVTRSSPSAPRGARSVSPTELRHRPGEIRVVAPPNLSGRAAKDWEKIVDKLYEQDYAKARRRLDDWERHYGQTTETRNLASQLDALPPEAFDERGD